MGAGKKVELALLVVLSLHWESLIRVLNGKSGERKNVHSTTTIITIKVKLGAITAAVRTISAYCTLKIFVSSLFFCFFSVHYLTCKT